jgi:KaiC/GvpD/RAD55 family RecA-like ATPase
MIDRVKTYIEGFDERLNGGIPGGSVVLLVGEPGTLKSSIAYNLLFNNAQRDNIAGLYVTLEQSTASITKHMKGMGWDPAQVAGKVEMLDIGIIRKRLTQLKEQSWMQVFKMYIKSLRDTTKYDILVIDSLPVLEILAKFKDPREELFQLFEWLRDLNVTTILISEMNPNSRAYAKYDEDFLADGIIHLRMREEGEASVHRHVRCVKMRATSHHNDYFSLLFEKGTFKATRVIAGGKL